MTRIGRFVALVGSVVIGIAVAAALAFLRTSVAPDSSVLAWIWLLVVPAAFGLTVAACYTWTVDGPIRWRRR